MMEKNLKKFNFLKLQKAELIKLGVLEENIYLEIGTFTQDDITWIKHECAERHHELKYDSGYNEAHERAQSRYEGYPWENKF